jgi:hypothetical protein
MGPILYFLLALVVMAGCLIGLAALWASDMKDAGKVGVEGDLIKEGDKARKAAEDAAAEEKARLEKLFGPQD